MSSPAGLRYSEVDFLAQWMPSSTRAGVILNVSPDLTGSAPRIPATGSTPTPLLNDSFASDFSPLPASADSSCFGMDGCPRPLGGETTGTEKMVVGLPPVSTRILNTQFDEVAVTSQDLPLMIKLEQLRKWQQHMQEQLKAHQLEEMLQLQDEQQRLLGLVNGSKPHRGVGSELSGPDWDEDELHPRPEMNSCDEPQRTHGLHQQLSPPGEMEELFKDQDHDEVDDGEESEENVLQGMWNCREENQEQSAGMRRFLDNDDTLMQPEGVSEGHSRREENILLERPIRPGIGAQKQTFEELLEEQLRLEEQRLKSAQHQQRQNGAKTAREPKRTFLKRGEGLSRFTNKASSQKVEEKKEQKLQSKARVISHRNSASASIKKGGSNRSPRHPVQRKTATLNKENQAKGLSLPPQGSKAAWTKVLGGHQRQNTDGLKSVKTDPELGKSKQHVPEQVKEGDNRQVGQSIHALTNCGPNKHCNPVTKQVGTCGGSEKTDSDATNERSYGAEFTNVRTQLSEGGGVSRDSFELTFQEKLRHWECNKQLENMELGEFELLEQAAEELSFSSNSSFVTKILQMDQQKWQLQAARGLHQRRLSSTPIKSPSRGEPQKSCRVQCGDAISCKIVSVDSGASVKMRADTSRNKVSTEIEDAQDSEREDKPEVSDISSGGGSEFGDEEVVVRGTICFPAQSNPPYDKRSYEDEDSLRDSRSDVPQEENEESGSVLCNEDDSTLIEDKDIQQGRVVFDDDDTWNDLEETAISKVGDSRDISPVSKSTASTVSPVEKTLLRKVAVRKAVVVDQEPDPPPASQLMTRLFPSLKPKAQNAPVPPPPAESASNRPKDDSGQQVQSTQLRERLVELEIEIERFKKENVALTKLRQENEKKHEDLRKERTQFEQIKAEELAKFEEYKKEENRKLQKERKLFEKYASAARAIPDKKEREEIQSLKQQLSSLQEELKRRESRWGSTHNRLRQQIDSLNKENHSLRDEIKMLEKLRLSAWKKSSVSAENDTEKKDGPRTLDNNSPPVTKGVTFASPLDSTGSGCNPPQSGGAAATRTSKDSSQGAAAGMKSSLKRSSGSASSSSLFDRRENNPAAASNEQEKPLNHQHMEYCSGKDLPPKQLESSEASESESAQEVITHTDGKIEKVLTDGDRLIIFPNGTRKEVSADGLSAKVTFFNGDTKEITADQRVTYFYAKAQTTHITYPDGLEVLHFPNNQTEKHFPDGHKEITFPDQTVKNLFPDGTEESVLTDGTIIQVNPDGTKEIHFNTGQKEIHTADFKRREYPDGTVKTVYADGRQETCYPTGRLRVKDKDGNVILDSCRNAREKHQATQIQLH